MVYKISVFVTDVFMQILTDNLVEKGLEPTEGQFSPTLRQLDIQEGGCKAVDVSAGNFWMKENCCMFIKFTSCVEQRS